LHSSDEPIDTAGIHNPGALTLRPSLSLRPVFVIAGLTRNPVSAWHWIPDVETPDLIRGRDDKAGSE